MYQVKLSPIIYYSDFVAYPILIATIATVALEGLTVNGAAWWLAICSSAVLIWTLLEYALHRAVFHRLPVIRDMHEYHHSNETASTGTPIWMSLAAHLSLVLIPLYLLGGFALSSAISTGLMIGYLWYVCIHHAIHHFHPSHGGYLYWLKQRHALHHHIDGHSNYGVTTEFWDAVFGTVAAPRLRRQPSHKRPSVTGSRLLREEIEVWVNEGGDSGNGRSSDSTHDVDNAPDQPASVRVDEGVALA